MEAWRPVVGYEGSYEVSDCGRVRGHRGLKKQGKDRYGYPRVTLSRPGDGLRGQPIHRLVTRAFLGDPPTGWQVRHIDGDQTNNHLWNLAYGTVTENARDRAIHGTQQRGETNGKAVLTEDLVRQIRARSDGGEPYRRIAKDIGVSSSAVHHVLSRRTWKHIE